MYPVQLMWLQHAWVWFAGNASKGEELHEGCTCIVCVCPVNMRVSDYAWLSLPAAVH